MRWLWGRCVRPIGKRSQPILILYGFGEFQIFLGGVVDAGSTHEENACRARAGQDIQDSFRQLPVPARACD